MVTLFGPIYICNVRLGYLCLVFYICIYCDLDEWCVVKFWGYFCFFMAMSFPSMVCCWVLVHKWMICVTVHYTCIAWFDYFSCICLVISVVFVLFCIFFSVLRMCSMVLKITIAFVVYIQQFSSSLYKIIRFSCIIATYNTQMRSCSRCTCFHMLVWFHIGGSYILFD